MLANLMPAYTPTITNGWCFQDWVEYEEIADVEERVVSNYFENMIQSIQSAISTPGSAQASNVAQKTQDTPIASSNDEENVSTDCVWFMLTALTAGVLQL